MIYTQIRNTHTEKIGIYLFPFYFVCSTATTRTTTRRRLYSIVLVKLYLLCFVICFLFFPFLLPVDKSVDFSFILHPSDPDWIRPIGARRGRRDGTGFPLIKRKGRMRYRSATILYLPSRPSSSTNTIVDSFTWQYVKPISFLQEFFPFFYYFINK